MQLICIKGEGKNDALFVNINTNELIKGSYCVWNGSNVSWGYGDYYGNVSNYLKIK
jgi:hypothetical protein